MMVRVAVAVMAVGLLAGCGGGNGAVAGPEAVAGQWVEAAIALDPGGTWELTHPAIRETSSRSDYTACVLSDAAGGLTDATIDVGETYEEDGFTFVDVAVKAETLAGVDAVTLTVMALPDDAGEWWVVGAISPGQNDDESCLPEARRVRDGLVAAAA
jgi:hypothetical protein